MINIPRPIIGYVGWITDRRLDANLIYEVAKQCPSYSFVMSYRGVRHSWLYGRIY